LKKKKSFLVKKKEKKIFFGQKKGKKDFFKKSKRKKEHKNWNTINRFDVPLPLFK